MKIGEWIEIFRAGDYGQKGEYTEEDISLMAENFDENDKVPIVIGHPKDNDPAWGWLDRMTAAGDILLARIGDLHEDMHEAINYSGLFKNRSVRIADKENGPKIMHLGMLGGTLPEVSGMAPLTFNNDLKYKDFEESFEPQKQEKTQPTKGKGGGEKGSKSSEEPGGDNKPKEGENMTEAEIAALKKQAEENAARAEAAEAKATAAEAEASSLKEQHEADMAASRRKGYEATVKDFPNMIGEKDQTAFVEFCMAQKSGEDVDFSFDDGNGKKTVDPAQWFIDFVSSKEEEMKKLKGDKPHRQRFGADFSSGTEQEQGPKKRVNLAAKL